jgi:hypothetical protein
MVVGEPGAGKTVLASQYLIDGINNFAENGLLVSMKDNKRDYVWEMKQFGWDFASAEKKGKFSFVDASPIRVAQREVKTGKLTIGRQGFSLLSLLRLVRKNAKTINAKRIVVDSLSMLELQYPNGTQRRKAILATLDALGQKEYAAKWQKAAERLLEREGYRIIKVEYEDHPRPIGKVWAGVVNSSELGHYLWDYSDIIVAYDDWYVVDVKAKWYQMVRKQHNLISTMFTRKISFTQEELRVYPQVQSNVRVLVILYRSSPKECDDCHPLCSQRRFQPLQVGTRLVYLTVKKSLRIELVDDVVFR